MILPPGITKSAGGIVQYLEAPMENRLKFGAGRLRFRHLVSFTIGQVIPTWLGLWRMTIYVNVEPLGRKTRSLTDFLESHTSKYF